jgi:hypothetical protein
VKDGVGIGKQIVTNFLAPVNPACLEEYISYSQELNKYPDEFYLVQTKQYDKYCKKQCLKLCRYL